MKEKLSAQSPKSNTKKGDELRCGNCNRLLGKGCAIMLVIKCKCGTYNNFSHQESGTTAK